VVRLPEGRIEKHGGESRAWLLPKTNVVAIGTILITVIVYMLVTAATAATNNTTVVVDVVVSGGGDRRSWWRLVPIL
jgi:hypothetical protein